MFYYLIGRTEYRFSIHVSLQHNTGKVGEVHAVKHTQLSRNIERLLDFVHKHILIFNSVFFQPFL